MKSENHAKDLNRHLTIKDIQMTNKRMKDTPHRSSPEKCKLKQLKLKC